ncbi:MAG: MarR family transcriptional regulator [Alphaproteobacteria bacterium]|nr:MarR family transcriptional regulator [Alphaproteobacteria bacterium]
MVAADGRLYLRDQDLDQGAALIRAAARRLAALAESATVYPALSGPEMDVLLEIFDVGSLDVGELRNRLAAPKQSLARYLNDLEGRGLLKRETSSRDRRRRLVALTSEGAAFARQATDRRRMALREAFLTAGPDAVTGARRVLTELARRKEEP